MVGVTAAAGTSRDDRSFPLTFTRRCGGVDVPAAAVVRDPRPMSQRLCLAIDIGGTKLAVGVVDEEGRLLERRAQPTPTGVDGNALFTTLADLVSTLGPFDRYEICGVGCGGPMSAGGELVSPLNILPWRNFPLRERLEIATGLTTLVDNDAKALALAEGWVGAAVGVSNYMAMVVSTGIGGGIVLNGRLLEGASGNAGHVGHLMVADPGRALPNHVDGALESEASGTAIAHHTGRPAKDATETEIDEVATLVGRAAGSVANLLDLRLVVVAGSVALGYGDRFFAGAQREVDRVTQLDYSRGTIIRPAACGDEGPLIGAGAVGFRGLGMPLAGLTFD